MINLNNFEMPINRLLTEEESDLLNANGINTDWISCKFCRETGATTDGRDYCSISCFSKDNKIDQASMNLLKKSIYVEEIALKGDYVKYNDEILKIFETDSSIKRVQSEFRQTYSYILIKGNETLKLFDLETPLRKVESRAEENIVWPNPDSEADSQ